MDTLILFATIFHDLVDAILIATVVWAVVSLTIDFFRR